MEKGKDKNQLFFALLDDGKKAFEKNSRKNRGISSLTEAIELMEEEGLSKVDPDQQIEFLVDAYYLRGELYRSIGDKDNAREDYKKIKSLIPSNPRHRYHELPHENQ